MSVEICVKCGREMPPKWIDPKDAKEAVARYEKERHCPGGCVWALRIKEENDNDFCILDETGR